MDHGYKNVYALKGGWHMWGRFVNKDVFQIETLPDEFDYTAYMSGLLKSGI